MPSQAATPQTQPVFSFTIPQGLLAAAIRQFESITGLTVTVADDLVRNLTSEGVTGTFTAAQGLDRLLAGSGLSHRSLSADTVVIEIRVSSDTVEVTSGAPRVQSSKYSAELTETPQTIQVIPRALLEEQGAATLTDALRNVPGITMQAGEGGGASNTSGDMFNMRGFSANNSIFVDGVRDDGMLSRDVFNLEQIEVFSGPTGSDVGRTNAAGYVNLTTKTPQRAATRDASVSYGSREQVRTTADVNQPFSLGDRGTFLGEAAVRVNVLWQDGGVAGRDYAGRVEQGDRALGRVRSVDAHSRHTLGTDSPPGQSGRLWPASGRLSCRSTDRHVGSRSFPRRPVQLLRQPGFRLRPRQSGQRRAAGGARLPVRPDASKSDPLQRVNA